MTSTTASPSLLDAAIAQVSEFPEGLGPVLIKELRQGLRSGLFVLPFVVLPAVLGLVAVWALSIDHVGSARSGVSGFFWMAVIVPVLIITPLRALGAIRSEREAQTLDLLMLTPLSAWRIVLAKWSSLQAQALLWVLALLPFLVLRYFFGAMNLTEELLVLLWVVVCGGVLTAAGLVVSTMPKLVFWLSLTGIVFMGIVGLWTLLIAVFSSSAFTRILGTGGGLPSPLAQIMLLLMAGHVTYLALAFSSSRIAPIADNYALRLRGGALALFVWFAVATVALPLLDQEARWGILVIAAVAATLFTTIDLTSARTPLLTHVRSWARFGPLGLFVGRSFMPGWPGAVVFFSGVTLLVIAITIIATDQNAEIWAGALLLWPTVMFPRALQCFFASRENERPALHLLLHLVGPLLASTLAAFSFALGEAVIAPAALFPPALWWLVTFKGVKFDTHVATICIVGAFWTLALSAVFFHHSRAYWAMMARHAATVRNLKWNASTPLAPDPRSGST